MSRPNLIFGAGHLGISFPTTTETIELLDYLKTQKIRHIDTARRYPGPKPGQSEKLLGDSKAVESGFVVDTKINIPASGPNGSLTREKILESVAESLAALRVKQVNTLYCHAPDLETSATESANAFDEAFKSGTYRKLGLCNYSTEQVALFIDACPREPYHFLFLAVPKVYQGQYNALCRGAEERLFPLLRRNEIVFNAYSPLAGGFLTGKLTSGENVAGTRFDKSNRTGAVHQNWYDKPVMHSAIRKLQDVIAPLNLTVAEVSLRWLAYHSALGARDAIILGGSTFEQIGSNVTDIAKGPLEDVVVEALDKMWLSVRDEAPQAL